jgi:hypothetical protein
VLLHLRIPAPTNEPSPVVIQILFLFSSDMPSNFHSLLVIGSPDEDVAQ